MKLRLREYFRYRHKGTNMDDWQTMLQLMSPKLRGEVAIKQCGVWIDNVPFFKGAPQGFVVDIALKLKSETYPQTEAGRILRTIARTRPTFSFLLPRVCLIITPEGKSCLNLGSSACS